MMYFRSSPHQALLQKEIILLSLLAQKTHIHLKSIVIIFLIADVPMYHFINKFT